jgi:hypothetical protein
VNELYCLQLTTVYMTSYISNFFSYLKTNTLTIPLIDFRYLFDGITRTHLGCVDPILSSGAELGLGIQRYDGNFQTYFTFQKT